MYCKISTNLHDNKYNQCLFNGMVRDGHGQGMDRVYPYPTRKAYPWMPEYQYPLISISESYPDILFMDIHTLPKTHLFIYLFINTKHLVCYYIYIYIISSTKQKLSSTLVVKIKSKSKIRTQNFLSKQTKIERKRERPWRRL